MAVRTGAARRGRESYLWLAAAIVAAIFSVSVGAGAHADNLVPTGHVNDFCGTGYPDNHDSGVCKTDTVAVWWHMSDGGDFELEANDRAALQGMLNDRFGPTDLTFTYDSTPILSGENETDWIYQEGPVPAGGVGVTWCNKKVVGTTWYCDQHYIKLAGGRYLDRRITCHETGHAVGLTHGDWSWRPHLDDDAAALGCMRTPLEAITDDTLGPDNRDQINAAY